MNFNNRLELTQSQKLVMTTQLKQSLSILNMSKAELEEEIRKESEENPLLDIERKEEVNWEAYVKSMDNGYKRESNYNPDNDLNLENIIREDINLYEHLSLQIGLYKINDIEKEVCNYIIDSLDEDGYLRSSEKLMINELNIEESTFLDCLKKVQQLDPIGVGARNLAECLTIQIKNLGDYDQDLINIINEDLDLIALNKVKEISKKHKIPMQRCVNLVHKIKSLDPRPGRLCCSEKTVYVQPDVIVEKIDNEFVVYTNEKDAYMLRINNFYREILKNSSSDNDAKEFIKSKLNSATNLVKNIQSRNHTILKIAETIVSCQEEFFNKGPQFIKPLKLKDIAHVIECHESTVSRGVNGKYMLTPFGVYEFKYFFSSAIETQSDEMASSTSIKKIIKETIKSENKKKPLSDEQLSKILKESGISVARRTVAKYREALKIPSSSKRKEY
ncbi:RNA polymerase factor sigma-54 [Paraclostridium ghonii]|uniref:RNA polymerase sigma-54 factor n=1 Tax=Paraclostridium ghonii TaxID=29358 RepID=A0ABU0N2X0_9FIRM|nr:RNA polymerase factor sigma-54 [Paeniclostridium ghonii]MDQ0557508.1 RNA polymerase sigma-54 factor [Paeniclostridium ghonii]